MSAADLVKVRKEREQYLNCLGYRMGIEFISPQTSSATSSSVGDDNGGTGTNGDADIHPCEDEGALTQLDDLRIDKAQMWKPGAATRALAKYQIIVNKSDPKKGQRNSTFQDYVLPPLPQDSTNKRRVNQVQPINAPKGSVSSYFLSDDAVRGPGLSKTKLGSKNLGPSQFQPPLKRSTVVPPPPRSQTVHETVGKPVLHNCGEGDDASRKRQREEDLDAGQQFSFKTARTKLVEEDKKKGIKRTLDPPREKPMTEGQSSTNKDENKETNTELEELMANENLKSFDKALVQTILSEIMESRHETAWSDIAGLAGPKQIIEEVVVWPMRRPDLFKGLRSASKGILLFGPPGTGKTMIGRVISAQSNSTFFNISASSLTSKWIGDGEKLVRCLFQIARIKQPSIIFIDEIDSILTQRSDTEHESSRRLKTEFLIQFDGCGTNEEDRLLVIGVTNRPQELDEAARRRLAKRIYIPLPDFIGRKELVMNLMKNQKHKLSEEEIVKIAEVSERYSGADMKLLCQEASFGPLRDLGPLLADIPEDQVRSIELNDFMNALRRVKSSVAVKDLKEYEEWDASFGCHTGE